MKAETDPDVPEVKKHPENQGVKILVIHETNGRKYLEGIAWLQASGEIQSLAFIEASAVWKLAHSILRENKSILTAVRQSMRNLAFRFASLSVRDHVIILALAPWDYRFLWYSLLRKRNRMIYNSSWPWWGGARVPNTMGFLTNLLSKQWIRILSEKTIDIVAVTNAAARAIEAGVPNGNKPKTIPHLVSQCFFERRARYNRDPFRILFIGELTKKKGADKLPLLMEYLEDEPVSIEIIGDGPMRKVIQELTRSRACRWHGQISDRNRISQIASECQALVSPSLRSKRWEELFGLSIAEGMAAGLTCIATDHIGPSSLVTSGFDGFIVPDCDIAAMATRIRQMCADPVKWSTISDNASLTAQKYAGSNITDMWRSAILGTKETPT